MERKYILALIYTSCARNLIKSVHGTVFAVFLAAMAKAAKTFYLYQSEHFRYLLCRSLTDHIRIRGLCMEIVVHIL